MSETLTERVADIKSEESREEPSIRELAHSLTLEDYTVFVETLDDEKYKLGDLKELAKNTIDEVIDEFESNHDVDLHDEVVQDIHELVLTVRQAWDTELKMFRLDYNTNDQGQIHEFYIPFESELLDDIPLFQVYDSNGDFVADELEDQLGSNLTRLESADLYVPSIPYPGEHTNVYEKKRVSEQEVYEDSLETMTSFSTTGQAMSEWIQSVLILSTIGVVHFVFGVSLFWLVAVAFVAPEIIAKSIPRVVTIPMSMILAIINSKKHKNKPRKSKLFKFQFSD